VHNQFIILQTSKTLNCSFDKQLRPSFTFSNSHTKVDLSVITTIRSISVLCANHAYSEMTYTVSSGTLNPSIPYHTMHIPQILSMFS